MRRAHWLWVICFVAACGGGDDDSGDDDDDDDNVADAGPDANLDNRRPTANAGDEQTVDKQTTVTLDGTGSSDPDGDDLTYSWTLTRTATGSTAVLMDADTAMPTFFADIPGTYDAELRVSDGDLESTPSEVVIRAQNSEPVAVVGDNQVVDIGTLVTIDASASYDDDIEDTLSFTWVLETVPTGSTATIDDPTSAITTFTTDVEGHFVARVDVFDGFATTSIQVGVVSRDPLFKLAYSVVDAEYSAALDAIVMVSSPPFELHIFDPVTESDAAVTLPVLPTAVSVSPDGLFAAVGHDGWMSYVDLTTGTLVKTIGVTANTGDIVLAGNGYAYSFPLTGGWDQIRCMEVATEVETLHTGFFISDGTNAKLHPIQGAIYGADNGISPSDIEKYDIAPGTAAYVTDSPYHGEYAMCGDLWFTEDGGRIVTRCGHVFLATTVPATDMTYNGSLGGLMRVTSMADSTESGTLVVIPADAFLEMDRDTELQFYDNTFLTLDATVTTPSLYNVVFNNFYTTHGKFVFWRADGSEFYALLQTEDTAPDSEVFVVHTGGVP